MPVQTHRTVRIGWLALFVPGLACNDSISEEGKMILSSKAFEDGSAIPVKYTEDGKNVSPPLSWTGIPAGTQSLVLIVDDPDAPDPRAPRRTWVHWVLFNIPPNATALPEGVKSKKLPEGAGEGMNDWNRTGYGGPAPPTGRHRYVHKLYALDIMLEGMGTPTKSKVVDAMQGHVLAEAKLVGSYERVK
jgi:hypothetical protein